MDNSNLLTIVLTLKDRSPFTYRWMTWMNENKCPYKILIADGGKDKEVEKYLKNYENYPYLNYEYIRYPYDTNLELFYEKFVDIHSRVKTKYVIMGDNDDFFNIGIFSELISFMEHNPNYSVASCNNTLSFRILDKNQDITIDQLAWNKKRKIEYSQYIQNSSIEDNDALKRLEIIIKNYSGIFWYGVVKTKDMQLITNILKDDNYRITNTNEYLLIFSLSLLGKMHLLNSSSHLARQQGTSQGAAIKYEGYGDTVHLMCTKDWQNDFEKLSLSLSKLFDYDNNKFRVLFNKFYSSRLKNQIVNEYKFHNSFKRFLPLNLKQNLKLFLGKSLFDKRNKDFEERISKFLNNSENKN